MDSTEQVSKKEELNKILISKGKEAILSEAETSGLEPRNCRFKCPFQGCSGHVTKNKNVAVYTGPGGVPLVKCHRCDTVGTIVDLYMATRGISFKEALEQLQATQDKPKKSFKPPPTQKKEINQDNIKTIQIAWDAMSRLEPETEDSQEIKYLRYRGIVPNIGLIRLASSSSNNKQVAYYARHGHTIGMACVNMAGFSTGVQLRMAGEPANGEPKIISLKGSRLRGSFFGFPQYIQSASTIAVCEGMFDTLAVHAWAGDNVVVVGAPGKDFLPSLADELSGNGVDISGKMFILFPQNDKPNNHSLLKFRALAGKLMHLGAWVILCRIPSEYKDAAEFRLSHPDESWPPESVKSQINTGEASSSDTDYYGINVSVPIPSVDEESFMSTNLKTLMYLIDSPINHGVIFGKQETKILRNAMTDEIIINGRPLKEEDLTTIDYRIGLNFKSSSNSAPLSFGVDNILRALKVVSSRNYFHPVKDYLYKLSWDGVPRFLDLIKNMNISRQDDGYFITEDKLITKWFVAAVARAAEPGCKQDSVLILHGPQYIGKSTFFSILGREWFSDEMMSLDDKDSKILLRKFWIIEWAELDSMRKARDQSLIKSFISRRVDSYRPPYGRIVCEAPRHCVIVGTTNDDFFLRDPTGSRRFWTINIQRPMNLSWIEDNRDQLWAEALRMYEAGETWHLDYQSSIDLESHNEGKKIRDPWVEDISEYVIGKVEIKIEEVLDKCIKKPLDIRTKSDWERVAMILRILGFEKKRARRDSKRQWFWIKPTLQQAIINREDKDLTE